MAEKIRTDGQRRLYRVDELTLFVENRPRTQHGLSSGVDPAFSGRGIGDRLIRSGLDYAFNWLGVTRGELEVFHNNQRVRRLYQHQRIGFEQESLRRKACLRDG